MEQSALYNAYNFSVPWNAAANTTVGNTRINSYHCPSNPGQDSLAPHYAMVTGPGMLFDPNKPECRGLSHIIDGTSNTIAVVEVGDAHISSWIEPGDLSTEAMNFTINDSQPRTKPAVPCAFTPCDILSHHPGGAYVVFYDGSVRFLKNSLNTVTLRALLSPAGGEVISSDSY
jgi:prepilin-type processing-associated H-X9-DG protein